MRCRTQWANLSRLKPVIAILRALSLAAARDLRGLESIKVNNFFLFVALLVWGAAMSGVEPASAEPFIALMVLLLLFPLSADPLHRLPRLRFASWPLAARQRIGLRLASLALSPVLWLAAMVLAWWSWRIALGLLVPASAVQSFAAIPVSARWNPLRKVPPAPGRFGGLVRNHLRQALSVLDTYLAILLSLAGGLWRLLGHPADRTAFPFLAMLVALALSTGAQSLFALDSAAGATRYRLLPLRGWQILLSKDIAFLAITGLLVLPLALVPGLTFGLASLAIGHYASVRLDLPQQRWRFSSGRLIFGVAQIVAGAALASHPVFGFPAAAVAWGRSLYRCGRTFDLH